MPLATPYLSSIHQITSVITDLTWTAITNLDATSKIIITSLQSKKKQQWSAWTASPDRLAVSKDGMSLTRGAPGRCETFIYGGCRGNANNFETAAAYKDSCQPKVTNGIRIVFSLAGVL